MDTKYADNNRNSADDERPIRIDTSLGCDTRSFGDWHRELDGTLLQLDPGVFRGDSHIIDLHDVLLVKRKSNLRYFDCVSMPGFINFVFPLSTPGPTFADESKYSEVKQVVFNDGIDSCSCSVYPEKFQSIVAAVKLNTIEDYLNPEEAGIFLSRLNSPEKIVVEKRHKEAAAQFVHQMYKKIIESCEMSPNNKVLVGQYSKLIILYLFEYISNSKEKAGTLSSASNYEKILDRALHYIVHQDGAPISMEQLSQEIYASKRSIQYAFSKLVGMTPMEFCKLARLNAIKSDLMDRGGNDVVVSHILHKYHISNSGRFRQEYFNFFGEYPKDTIA